MQGTFCIAPPSTHLHCSAAPQGVVRTERWNRRSLSNRRHVLGSVAKWTGLLWAKTHNRPAGFLRIPAEIFANGMKVISELAGVFVAKGADLLDDHVLIHLLNPPAALPACR